MALPLGKLAILIGAGILGSALAKERSNSTISDYFSGAVKIAFRQLRKRDDSGTPKAKPRNDSLLQQVNNLREELQLLASNKSITIVTSTGSGSGKYGVILVVVVVGYGYIWWKGWKLSGMMFATRRGLSDACGSVSKQLETVYSSIAATKRQLSSKIDGVDGKIDECAEHAAATTDEVSMLRGDVQTAGTKLRLVRNKVEYLGTRLVDFEKKQRPGLFGIYNLVPLARMLEKSRTQDPIQGAVSSSSIPALEFPQVTPSRAASFPSNLLVEPPLPSSNGSVGDRGLGVIPDAGLRLQDMPDGVESTGRTSPPVVSSNRSSGSGIFGLRSSSGISGSMVRRSCSAKLSFNI